MMYFSQLPEPIRNAMNAVIAAAEDHKALKISMERAQQRVNDAKHDLATLIDAHGANNAA
jgi:regulator of protease activity HflC (stomatin/prohibitin superfamily)